MRSPLSLLLSKLDKPKVLSHSSQDMPSNTFTSFVAFLWMHSRTFTSFLICGAQNRTQYSRWGSTNAEYRGIIPSFDYLVVLCLMHSRMLLALLAARAHCWLILSLLSSSTPRSPSAGLLSSYSSPNLYLGLVLLCPRCRIRHLDLITFMLLIIAQCSSLSRSLCKASCPSGESIASPSLVPSANLLMEHWTPTVRSSIIILDRTDPRIEHWGTPLVVCCQPDVVAPFTPTDWALPFSYFFTQWTISALIPQLDNLCRRVL